MRSVARRLVDTAAASARASPAFAALAARIGHAQAHRELRWLADHCLHSNTHHTHLPSLIDRRASGEPLQYLIGSVSFCGLSLECRAPVLIPRPETEQLCDWIIHTINDNDMQWKTRIPFHTSYTAFPANVPALSPSPPPSPSVYGRGLRVLDLCSGSGNIALSLARHLRHATVTGIDINPAAIKLSQSNAVKNSVHLATFHRCDLMTDSVLKLLPHNHFDIIVSNPPYIAHSERPSLQTEVRNYEDPHALFASNEGLSFYERILPLSHALLQSANDRRDNSQHFPELVVEVGSDVQAIAVQSLCRRAGFERSEIFDDWNDAHRWVAASRATSSPTNIVK